MKYAPNMSSRALSGGISRDQFIVIGAAFKQQMRDKRALVFTAARGKRGQLPSKYNLVAIIMMFSCFINSVF